VLCLCCLLSACPDEVEKAEPDTAETADSDTSPCTPTLWYTDADHDGYGASGTGEESCDAPTGTVANASDCDDGNAEVYPGAEELCEDGVVNDCDATSDADALAYCARAGMFSLANADATLLGAAPREAAGWRLKGAQDLNGDGRDDLLVGLGYGATIRVAEVLSSVSGVVSLSSADAAIYTETDFSGLGIGLSGVGDVDGDGFADALIGDGAFSRAYLVLSPVTGDLSAGDADAVFSSGEPLPYGPGLGYSVVGPGDVDGDGQPDLLLGAPAAEGLAVESDRGGCASEGSGDDEGPGVDAGIAYLFTTLRSGSVDAEAADAQLIGEDAGDLAGNGLVGLGDMDGDGLADIAFSAPGNCEGGTNEGAIYVVLGSVSGDLYLGDADGKIYGNTTQAGFDATLSEAGDTNGDGTPDLISANPGYDRSGSEYAAGVVYVYLGPILGTEPTSDGVAATIRGARHEQAGGAMASAGDLDADGYDDILVGALGYGSAGAVCVLYGPLSGTIELDDAETTWFGEDAEDNAGYAVAGVGDTDGDGMPDILIGAPDNDAGGHWAGAAYLLLSGGALLSGSGVY